MTDTPTAPALVTITHRVDALTPIPLRNQRRIATPADFEQVLVPYMGGQVSCAVGYEDGELQLHLIEMGGWFSALDMLSDKVFRELEAAAVKASSACSASASCCGGACARWPG